MKTSNDRRIQEALDKKNPEFKDFAEAEFSTYSNLYDALGQLPDFTLPESFAKEVVLKVEKKNRLKEQVFLCSGLMVAFVVFSAAIFLLLKYYPTISSDLRTLLEFKWVIIFSVFLVFAVQLLDWFLVKRKKVPA